MNVRPMSDMNELREAMPTLQTACKKERHAGAHTQSHTQGFCST